MTRYFILAMTKGGRFRAWYKRDETVMLDCWRKARYDTAYIWATVIKMSFIGGEWGAKLIEKKGDML